MNKLIKLFQSKADQAFEAMLVNRDQTIVSQEINSPGWTAAIVRGAALRAEHETWTKAADLLRKQELRSL